MSISPADPTPPAPAHPRRTVLRGALVAGLSVPALAACGGGDEDAAASGGTGGGATTGALTSTAAVPIGGGKVFESAGVVVTQPVEGTFKAFSSRCTHTGCAVAKVADGVIHCPCHGSQFSITDGAVKRPPAETPLETKKITVANGQITLG